MNILGIYAGHNASACLMVDGRVVGMIQEERLTNRKNQTGFPRRAIEQLIEHRFRGEFSKIDRVVYAGQLASLYWTALDHYAEFEVEDYVRQMREYWYPYFYERSPGVEESAWYDDYWRNRVLQGIGLNRDHNFDFSFLERLRGKEAFDYFTEVERREVLRRHFGWTGEVEFLEHHSCHAYWALWGAPLSEKQRREALVLTADSRGDNTNWSVSIPGEDGRLQRIAGGLENHVARIYKFTTLILGMRPNDHEYKVMGLSAYSRSRKHITAAERVFFEALDFRNGKFVSDRPLKDSYFDLKERLEGHRFDNVAAALQNWCTAVTSAWARHWLRETGRRGLCFSGGLSMNIKTNGELARLEELDWLSVPASGGDESLSAGACFRSAAEQGEPLAPVRHVYLGQDAADTAGDWAARLPAGPLGADEFAIHDGVDAEAAARLLAADCIVARCVGPAEFGARALGNRSILSNPANPGIVKFVNDAIKQRDFWMPFTPSILAEHADRYLDNPKRIVSPFMTIGFPSHGDAHRDLIAALHPGDFSARPQFVERDANPEYWRLIEAFHKLTGIPALLNTSLNLHGEPMNYSVADAVRTLALSDLEFLLLPGDRLLYKRTASAKLFRILGLHGAKGRRSLGRGAGAHAAERLEP